MPTHTVSPPTLTTQSFTQASPLLAHVGRIATTQQIFLFSLDTHHDVQLTTGDTASDSPSWSPDCHYLVYLAYREGHSQIWRMDRDGTHSAQLSSQADTNVRHPAVSPDGRWVAYFAETPDKTSLMVMTSDGLAPRILVDRIVDDNNLFSQPAFAPAWSPQSDTILFNHRDAAGVTRIAAVGLAGGQYTDLTNRSEDDSGPVWSPDGNRVAFHCSYLGRTEICTMAPDGSARRRLTYSAGENADPVWSPDSSRIAFASTRESYDANHCYPFCNDDIYVMNVDGTSQMRLTDYPTQEYSPLWSTDGTSLFFLSLRDEEIESWYCEGNCNSEIYSIPSHGGDPTRLTINTWPDYSLTECSTIPQGN